MPSHDLCPRPLAALIAVSLASLAGCGGGSSPASAPPDDSPTGTPSLEVPVGVPTPPPDDVVPADPVTPATPVEPGELIAYTGSGPLPPLPEPPLTPAPDADDEPVPETDPVSTAQAFFVVADPHGKLVDEGAPQLTDEDFDAGLPAATLRLPVSRSVEGNTVPYFEGLSNRSVEAGAELTIVLDPEDPDGGHPGMFPENLPEGARYVDNFDGTRSLIWRPLQPDVGITEFTIVAVDATEPEYRSAQRVLIRVTMPDDPSSIRNLPPGINQVRPSVARVGDPVVVKLKGTDPNGTIPTLTVPNAPAGATFVPHRSEPGMSVLRFVPDTAGTVSLRVVATDADDASLTLEKVFTIDVLEASELTLPGARLRELARAHDLLMGFAAVSGFHENPDGALYADIAGAEYDLVTSENQLKLDTLVPLPGVYRWAAADNLVSWARTERVGIHGHTLVWHRQLPGWLWRSDPAMREGHMRELIDRVMRRYAGDVALWDVVNESFEDDGRYRESVWYEGMGERYIDIAFRQARQSDPSAQLIYNDYDVAWAGPKADAMFEMLQGLTERGVPLDGVGFQVHVFADFDAFDEVRANFRRAAALGLDVYITELDVSIGDGQSEDDQAAVYDELLTICLESAACRAFQTWGFTDRYSWRRDYRPLPLDERYGAKPAYLAMQQRLRTGP